MCVSSRNNSIMDIDHGNRLRISSLFIIAVYKLLCVFSRYKLIRDCWEEESDHRPTFNKIVSIMGDFLEDNVRDVRVVFIFDIKILYFITCTIYM